MKFLFRLVVSLLIFTKVSSTCAALSINDPFDKNGNVVETAINSITPVPGTPLGNFILLLNFPPPFLDVPEIVSQLSPDLHGDMPVIHLAVGAQITELFSRHSQTLRTRNTPDGRTNIWVQSFVEVKKRRNITYFPGYEARIFGTLWGLDYFFDNPDFNGGIAAAYTYMDIKWKKFAGVGGSHCFFFGPYLTYSLTDKRVSGAFFDFALLAHYNRSQTGRAIPNLLLGNGNQHDTKGLCLKLGGGYNFYIEGILLAPFASVDYLFINEDAFNESVSALDTPLCKNNPICLYPPPVNLNIKSRNSDLLRVEVGSEIRQDFKLSREWTISPSLKASWVHKQSLLRSNITASFSGQSPFSVSPYYQTLNQISPGFILSILHKDDIALSSYYDLEIGNRQISHEVGVSASLKY